MKERPLKFASLLTTKPSARDFRVELSVTVRILTIVVTLDSSEV